MLQGACQLLLYNYRATIIRARGDLRSDGALLPIPQALDQQEFFGFDRLEEFRQTASRHDQA